MPPSDRDDTKPNNASTPIDQNLKASLDLAMDIWKADIAEGGCKHPMDVYDPDCLCAR